MEFITNLAVNFLIMSFIVIYFGGAVATGCKLADYIGDKTKSIIHGALALGIWLGFWLSALPAAIIKTLASSS